MARSLAFVGLPGMLLAAWGFFLVLRRVGRDPWALVLVLCLARCVPGEPELVEVPSPPLDGPAHRGIEPDDLSPAGSQPRNSLPGLLLDGVLKAAHGGIALGH